MITAPGAAMTAVLSFGDDASPPAPLIASLLTTMAGAPVELLVSGAREPALPQLPANWQYRWLPTPPGMLVPEQWGVGLRVATAPLIGFLTPDLLPAPSWWPTLQALVTNPGVAGAAGGIGLGQPSWATSGVYLTRYSQFFPHSQPTPVFVANLPGEVSLYRREALLACSDLVARGFWEIHYHKRLLASGSKLAFAAGVLATCHARPATVVVLQQRVAHAKQFGADQVRAGARTRAGITLRAPLVPVVLTFRSVRRALVNRWARRAILSGLAPLVLYSLGWGFGEAIGAWRAGEPE